MGELACKACGRELRAGMTFCHFCGSKDIISNAFNNVNNAYAYNKQAAARPNNNSYASYNNRYPNVQPKNNVYSNNMYANRNNMQQSRGYGNTTSDDFDKRMDQMQQNIRNRSLQQSKQINKSVNLSNDFSKKYGNDSYTIYENNSNTFTSKSINPYVANKDFYTHNKNHQSQNGYINSYTSDDDKDTSILGSLSNLQKGLISFAAVLVVGLVVLFFTGTFDTVINKAKATFKNDNTQVAKESKSDDKPTVVTGSGDLVYSVGELKDNVYTNPWSNVSITIPEGYTNKDEESYKQYATEFMSCGLYVENSDGESIVNLYIDLKNDDGTFTEEAYLNETKANYDSYGMEIVNATEYEKFTISGQEYLCMHLTAKSGSVTLTQSVYVRKVDDKACVFMITSKGESADNNKAIINTIQPYA